MKQDNKFPEIFAYGIGRCIVKMNFHPVFYFIIMTLCLIQTTLCFISEQYTVYHILKWFDFSIYINPHIVFYLLLGPCVICALLIVLQHYWAAKEQKIQTTIFQHFSIKAMSIMSYFLVYSLNLTVIRSATHMTKGNSMAEKALGLSCLLLYLVIIYTYTALLMIDLSPQNDNVFAIVSLPNCFTVLNFYRPLAALIVCINNSNLIIIPTAFLFFFLTVFLLKYPIITWRFNSASQCFISAIIWLSFIRIVQLITGQEVSAIITLIGIPIFVFFFQWLLHQRLCSIIKRQENSVLKLKILYFLLVNRDNYEEQLSIFLISHYRCCSISLCSCHRIMKTLQKQKENNQCIHGADSSNKLNKSLYKSSFSLMVKIKQSKKIKQYSKKKIDLSEQKQYEFQKQKELWFDLLSELQNEQCDKKMIRNLPLTEKDLKIKKAKVIILDQIQVLHYRLNKQYQSLRCLWFSEQIQIKSIFSLFTLARYLVELSKQEKTIKRKSKQDGSNQYALNYYELQTKILSFKELIVKTTLKAESFWIQLSSSQPDQTKLEKSLDQILKNRALINCQREKILSQNTTETGQAKNDYQIQWSMKIKQLIQVQFFHFCTVMKFLSNKKGLDLIIQNNNRELIGKKDQAKEKNILFYDYKSITGMGIVNIQDGQQFGSVSITNSQFWRLLNCERYSRPFINHFLVKQMHEYHTRTMVNFLQQNKHFLTFHQGFVIDGDKNIVEIEFSVQLLPHLYDGFYAAVFLQQIISKKSIFLTDHKSNILAYNLKFKQHFLLDRKVEEYDELVNREVINELKQFGQSKISFAEDEKINLTLRHSVNRQNEAEALYYCEISRQWDNVKAKSLAVENEIKDLFYLAKNSQLGSNETKQVRESIISKIEVKSKQKKQKDKEIQEEEELQSLVISLTKEKKSLNLKKFSIFFIVVLVIMASLAISITGISQLRRKIFQSSNIYFINLTNFIQHTSESVFICRKGNILSFNNKTQAIPALVDRLNNLEQAIISERLSINVSDWVSMQISFETNPNGQISKSNATLEMIIQKYLLSSMTTYIQQVNNWNFDYLNITTSALSASQTNLFDMIYNSYYTILPRLSSQFRDQMLNKWKMKILIHLPIIPIAVIVSVCGLILIFATIYVKLKVKNCYHKSLCLFQSLNLNFMDERILNLRVYLKPYHSENEQTQNQKKTCVLKEEQTKNLIQKSFLSACGDKLQPKQLSQITTRNFQLETTRQRQQTETINLKIKSKTMKLKFKQQNKIKLSIKIIAGLVILICLGMTICLFQVYHNIKMFELLNLKQLYNYRIENILKINSFTQQFGYERVQFRNKSLSLSKQLEYILQNTYQILRQIKLTENGASSYYFNEDKLYNQIEFCKILQQICQNSSCTKCTPDEQIAYNQKFKDEIIVQYLETTRSFLNSYPNRQLTTQEQRHFTQNPVHSLIEKQCKLLTQIETNNLHSLNNKYTTLCNTYQASIIGMGISMIPIIMFIGIYWLKMQVKSMQRDIDKIRTVIQMITLVEIRKNQDMRKTIMDKNNDFAFVT